MRMTITFRRLGKPHIAMHRGVWVWYWHPPGPNGWERVFDLDAFVGYLNSGS